MKTKMRNNHPLGFWGGAGEFFLRPASFMALSISHSICPFTLRNSSAAHFSRPLYVSSSILKTKLFFAPKTYAFCY